jgi:hypothetical protein
LSVAVADVDYALTTVARNIYIGDLDGNDITAAAKIYALDISPSKSWPDDATVQPHHEVKGGYHRAHSTIKSERTTLSIFS